jgi:hypothetical protein
MKDWLKTDVFSAFLMFLILLIFLAWIRSCFSFRIPDDRPFEERVGRYSQGGYNGTP